MTHLSLRVLLALAVSLSACSSEDDGERCIMLDCDSDATVSFSSALDQGQLRVEAEIEGVTESCTVQAGADTWQERCTGERLSLLRTTLTTGSGETAADTEGNGLQGVRIAGTPPTVALRIVRDEIALAEQNLSLTYSSEGSAACGACDHATATLDLNP